MLSSTFAKRALERGTDIAAKRCKTLHISRRADLHGYVVDQSSNSNTNTAYTIVVSGIVGAHAPTSCEEAMNGESNAYMGPDGKLCFCARGGDCYNELIDVNEATLRATIFNRDSGNNPVPFFDGSFVTLKGVEVVQKGERTYINAREIASSAAAFDVPDKFKSVDVDMSDVQDLVVSELKHTKAGKPYIKLRWLGCRCMLWKESLDSIWRQSFGFGTPDYEKLAEELGDIMERATLTGLLKDCELSLKRAWIDSP
jgi:hypothetical protein